MTEVMAYRLEGAPASSSPEAPNREGILGVLRACEQQTAAFNWNMMLLAVAKSLDYDLTQGWGGLRSVILQGALDMFPMVQSLPDDRVVYIRLPTLHHDVDPGVCPLVVWAPNIPDLTVLVKWSSSPELGPQKDVRFGTASCDRVIIERTGSHEELAISLLDPLHEDLLTIKVNPDTVNTLIGFLQKVHARGWGMALISESLADLSYQHSKRKTTMRELQLVCCAFTLIIATHLYRDDLGRLDLKDPSYASEGFFDQTADIPYNIDSQKIMTAA